MAVSKARSTSPGSAARARAGVSFRLLDREGGLREVTFGGVTVTVPQPDPEQVRRNVEASTAALTRMAQRLARPGVAIRRRKNVPIFYADPERPGRIVRELNGQRESGVIAKGAFKVQD